MTVGTALATAGAVFQGCFRNPREYPIDVMVIAKVANPDRFRDRDLGEWLIEFYQNVYGVDRTLQRSSGLLCGWTGPAQINDRKAGICNR